MTRRIPLYAFEKTILNQGAPGTGDLTAQDGGILLTQDGGALLAQGTATAPPVVTGFNGSAAVGPTAQGEVWEAGYTVSVHCATSVLEATCRVYCGSGVSPAYFTDGTTWGSTGDSTTNTPQLQVGQYVWAVWTGGDEGTEAYLVVTGTRSV